MFRSGSRTVVIVLFAIALLIGGVACGGGDDGAPTAGETQASDPSPQPTEEGAEEPVKSGPRLSTRCTKGPKAETVVALKAIDFGFKPGDLELPANQKVTVAFRNTGDVSHDFTIESLGCTTGAMTKLSAKAMVTFELGNKPIDFFCNIHKSLPVMQGKIIPKKG